MIGPSLLITSDGDDWHVWMSLERHDPFNDRFGFVIGSGATRDEAVADAISDLEGVVARLQAPPGDIEERDIR